MATTPLVTDDIAARIEVAQGLLKRENDRLEELMKLFTATKENIKHLEQLLLRYRAAATPSPIRRCPPEILGIIFKLLAVDYKDLDTVSLVCKQWYNLVLQDPRLWSTITVKLPYDEWNLKSWSRSSRSYIRKCMGRNRSSQLKVELDLSSYQTTENQLVNMLSRGLQNFTPYDLSDTDRDVITDWLFDLNYDALVDLEVVSNWDPGHVTNLVDELIGPDGQFMTRWDSLDIQFPENESASLLWEKLADHVADLSYLRIRVSEYDIVTPGISTPIWDLPNVKVLEVPRLCNWPIFLSLNPVSLQRLSTYMYSNIEGLLSGLASFVRLRSLTMTIPVQKDIEEYSLFFPLLQELIFEQRIRHLHLIKWNCPSLKRLTLRCAADEIAKVHPQSNWLQTRPSEVHWEDSFLYRNDWKVSVVRGVLQLFLLQFTSAEHLSVPFRAKVTMVDLLEKLSDDGNLPRNWKTTSFHYGDGENNETVSFERILGT